MNPPAPSGRTNRAGRNRRHPARSHRGRTTIDRCYRGRTTERRRSCRLRDFLLHTIKKHKTHPLVFTPGTLRHSTKPSPTQIYPPPRYARVSIAHDRAHRPSPSSLASRAADLARRIHRSRSTTRILPDPSHPSSRARSPRVLVARVQSVLVDPRARSRNVPRPARRSLPRPRREPRPSVARVAARARSGPRRSYTW